MEKFVMHGGKPLVGEVEISGAKNAAVASLPATILAGGKCVSEKMCIRDRPCAVLPDRAEPWRGAVLYLRAGRGHHGRRNICLLYTSRCV